MRRIWAILTICFLVIVGFFFISNSASAHGSHHPYPSHSATKSCPPTAVPPSTDNPTPTPTETTPTAVPPSTNNPTTPTAVPPSTNNPTTPIIINPPPSHPSVSVHHYPPKPAYSIGTAVATHRVSAPTSPVANERPLATTGFKASDWIWVAVILIFGGLTLLALGSRGKHVHK